MTNIAEELLGSPSETVETPAEPTPTTEVVADAEQTPPETPEETPRTGDNEVTPPDTPPVLDSESVGLKAAMHGEREKRQSVEKDFEAYKQAHPEKSEPAPSIFEDEAGALDHRDARLSQELTNTLLTEGRGEAYNQYDQATVDKAEAWFIEEAQKSPMLAKQLEGVGLLQQHRKVTELYQSEQKRAESTEDPAAYEARLMQKGVDEYIAKQQSETDAKQKLTDSIPKSLTGDSSKGGLTGSDWSGPVDLESVIGRGG